MDLDAIKANLDALLARHGAAGRTAFEQRAGQFLDSVVAPDSVMEAAQSYRDTLLDQLPVIPATEDDLTEAHRLSLQAAQRLRTDGKCDVIITTWPAPVAHEVAQLLTVLTRDRPAPEAGIMQLRDATETLTKLPAAVLACALLREGGDGAAWVKSQLMTVGGGKWLDLGRKAAEMILARDKDGPLAPLARLTGENLEYDKAIGALVKARNDLLGHAAMRPNPKDGAAILAWVIAARKGETPPDRDIDPRATPHPLTEVLAQAASASPWRGLRLVAMDGDAAIDLMGADSLTKWLGDPRHITHDDRALPLFLTGVGEAPLPLRPFLGARICKKCGRRDVFFFDSVHDAKRLGDTVRLDLDFVDYGRGHKARLKGVDVPDMRDLLEGQDLPVPVLSGDTFGDRRAMASLNSLRMDRRYQPPEYLRKALRDFMTSTDRGVFWLRAPANAGKTTLVQGLALAELYGRSVFDHQQDIARVSLIEGLYPGPNGGVVAFFCRRGLRDGRAAFLNKLREDVPIALGLDASQNALWPEPSMVLGAADPRAAMGRFLAGWRDLAPNRGNRPLLLIVDGLDEADVDPPVALLPQPGETEAGKRARETAKGSLFGLLPRATDLPPNTWVLLTSRLVEGDGGTGGDVTPWLAETMRPVTAAGGSASYPVRLTDKPHLDLLRAFVVAQSPGRGGKPPPAAFVESLLKQSEGRFHFLALLVGQYAGQLLTPAELLAMGQGPGLIDRFIRGLEDRHGQKLGDVMILILATLTAAEQAHHWCFGDGLLPDPVTGGDLEPVPREFSGMEPNILAVAIEMNTPPDRNGRRFGPDFIALVTLLRGALSIWRGHAGDPRYRIALREIGIRFAELRLDDVRRGHARLAHLCMDALEAVKAHRSAGLTLGPDDLDLCRFLFPRLPGLVALSEDSATKARFVDAAAHDAALALDAANLVSPVPGVDTVRWSSAILAAIEYGGGGARGTGENDNLRAAAYTNRGTAKQDAPGFGPGAAIADYDAAIGMRETLRDTLGEAWPVPWRNDLANAYMNRGNAKQDAPGFGPGAAIADYDAAIGMRETLRDTLGEAWPVPWRNDLAAAYTNRGNAKQSAPGFGPGAAIADYDASIGMRETLRDTLGEAWPVPWRNDLAAAYTNRGNAKQSAPGFGPGAAIADYDAAIGMRETLRDTLGEAWPVPWRNDLAAAYINRGTAKVSAPGFGPGAAIADYDAAIGVMETLRDSMGEAWPVPWRNDLAAAYINRGTAKVSAPGFGPGAAIADYDAAIGVMEMLRDTLGEAWPVPWRNDLAGAYMNRGNAKQSAPGFGPGAAIADYDASIGMRETLRDTLGEAWPVPWRNDLAAAYMNRGNAKQDAPGFGPGAAIADYDAAIGVMETLRDTLGEAWPVPWRNDLATAYMNRGIASGDSVDFQRAVALWDDLRAMLGDQFPPPWADAEGYARQRLRGGTGRPPGWWRRLRERLWRRR